VARIARTMSWKLYVGVSLSIVSRDTQQDVEVHTNKTRCGRNTRCAELQQLYRKRHLRDIRTWRSIDPNTFATENTSGKGNGPE